MGGFGFLCLCPEPLLLGALYQLLRAIVAWSFERGVAQPFVQTYHGTKMADGLNDNLGWFFFKLIAQNEIRDVSQ